MSLPVTRPGDAISHPGVVVTGSVDKITNGLPTSRITDVAICFIHGPTIICSGSPTYYVNGLNCSRITSVCGCGAVVVTGSPNSFTS